MLRDWFVDRFQGTTLFNQRAMVIAAFQVTKTIEHLTLSRGTLWMMTTSLTCDPWYHLVLGG